MTNLKKMIATGLAGIVLATSGCAVNNSSVRNCNTLKDIADEEESFKRDESKYPYVKGDNLYVLGKSPMASSMRAAEDIIYDHVLTQVRNISKDYETPVYGLKAVELDEKILDYQDKTLYLAKRVYQCPLSNFDEKTKKMLIQKYDNKNSKGKK